MMGSELTTPTSKSRLDRARTTDSLTLMKGPSTTTTSGAGTVSKHLMIQQSISPENDKSDNNLIQNGVIDPMFISDSKKQYNISGDSPVQQDHGSEIEHALREVTDT